MARLTSPQARALLATARVARLVTVTSEGAPHAVPVTFVLDGAVAYSAIDGKPKSTRGLRRLDNIRHEPRACLLADHYDEDWAALWWARADAIAAVIGDPAGMARPLDLLARRYPQYRQERPAGPVIALRVTRWTGWAAVPAGAGGDPRRPASPPPPRPP
jgi:PPOX class probable F420-dependent enzyme